MEKLEEDCAAEEADSEILECPITKTLLEDPVVATDGYTYSRQAITTWLRKSNTSPITREKIFSKLVPNRILAPLLEKQKRHRTVKLVRYGKKRDLQVKVKLPTGHKKHKVEDLIFHLGNYLSDFELTKYPAASQFANYSPYDDLHHSYRLWLPADNQIFVVCPLLCNSCLVIQVEDFSSFTFRHLGIHVKRDIIELVPKNIEFEFVSFRPVSYKKVGESSLLSLKSCGVRGNTRMMVTWTGSLKINVQASFGSKQIGCCPTDTFHVLFERLKLINEWHHLLVDKGYSFQHGEHECKLDSSLASENLAENDTVLLHLRATHLPRVSTEVRTLVM